MATPINGLKSRAPKRLFVIVEDDPRQGFRGVMGWENTKKAADEECRRYNRMRGYEPTCRVVEYVPADLTVCGRYDAQTGTYCSEDRDHAGNHTGHNGAIGVSWPRRRRA